MNAERCTVLVVEDSDDCAATIEIALGTIPYVDVRTVTCAEDALNFINNRAISALITDLHLPGMDGIELIANVRRKPGCSDIPILVVSGDSDRDTPDRARLAGATVFFSKPYSPVAVRATLERLIHAP